MRALGIFGIVIVVASVISLIKSLSASLFPLDWSFLGGPPAEPSISAAIVSCVIHGVFMSIGVYVILCGFGVSLRKTALMGNNQAEPPRLVEGHSASELSGNSRAPVGWALLRLLGTLMFLGGTSSLSVCMLWPLYVFYWGYDFPKPWPTVLLLQMFSCLICATILIVGLLLARLVARKFYCSVEIRPGQDSGWLGIILIATAASWPVMLYFADTEFSYAVVFLSLAAVVSALIVLVGRKPFHWQKYLLVGVGVGLTSGSVFSQAGFNACAVVQMVARDKTFASEIEEAATLFDNDDLEQAAIQGSQLFGLVSDTRGRLLVLNAESEGEKGPYQVRTSHLETHLPSGSLARDSDSLGVVVIVGPVGFIPFGMSTSGPFRLPGNYALGAPILVYKWPEKELVVSGKIKFRRQDNDPDMLQRDGANELAKMLGL